MTSQINTDTTLFINFLTTRLDGEISNFDSVDFLFYNFNLNKPLLLFKIKYKSSLVPDWQQKK